MARYGVFGSACDPITIGHLITMDMVVDRRHLDGILLIPSSDKRLDKGRDLTANEHRLAMIKLAIADNDKIKVHTVEMVSEGWETYTYDTMEKLKKEYPEDDLAFVMGADNLSEISNWHKGQELIENNTFIVMGREGYDMAEIIARDSLLIKNEHRFDCLSKGVSIETSSTLVRSRLKEGLSVRYLVPQKALEYAVTHNIYN